MNAKVTWHQGLTFTGSADTGYSVPLGASASVGGADDGFRPMELIALGLAGCTAMDVISILQKKRQVIDRFEVQVEASQAEEHPRVFTEIEITYLISGESVDERAVQRAIELSETKYCPAQAMLGKVVPISLHYRIEGQGE
jgi:putative redox protein